MTTGYRILSAILRRLSSIGIHIQPYFVTEENYPPTPVQVDDKFECKFFTTEHLHELEALDGTPVDRMAEWLNSGKLAFGVVDRDTSKIIAKIWCDLEEFNFPPCHRQLAEDEAYMFSSFCNPEYRGNNLGAFMRVSLFIELHKQGIERCCSYTNYFNVYARNYKRKIGSINKFLNIHINLWGFSRNFRIRNYSGQ